MLNKLADASAATSIMLAFVSPIVRGLAAAASLVCVAFLVIGGVHYMTSAGQPERLVQAKRVIRNALIGLVIVLSAATLTTILTHAYANSGSQSLPGSLPTLSAIQPASTSNDLVSVLIDAITGMLNSIIQSAGVPFLKALSYFTSSTPLLAGNSNVLNLWLSVLGMADVIFVLVIILTGFHVMSYASLGLDEINLKQLLPQLAVIFLLMNSSVIVIDSLISLSNVMIHALQSGPQSVWNALTDVTKQASSLGLAALLVMLVFLVFSVILLIYYVGRMVTLYIGAILSPLVVLLWLIPTFRDFAVNAAKAYIATIFVLFVHVVILALAASLIGSITINNTTHAPDALMAMVVGLATLVALLKTQGVMMQLSYASIGPRTLRKLGSQFITGVSFLGNNRSGQETMTSPYKPNRIRIASQEPKVITNTKRPSSSNVLSVQVSSTRSSKPPTRTAIPKPKPITKSVNKQTVPQPIPLPAPKPVVTSTAKLPTKTLPMNPVKAGQ